MIKTKIIKKSDVIVALKTERLKRGHWFTPTYELNKGEPCKKNCRVCAVGAVLRKVSFEQWARNKSLSLNLLGEKAVRFNKNSQYSFNSTSTITDVEDALKDKNYLGALSAYFEQGHIKKQCIECVKKKFPKKFKLSINSKNL